MYLFHVTKTSVCKKDVSGESLFYFYYVLILVGPVSGVLLSQSFLHKANITAYHKFSNAIRKFWISEVHCILTTCFISCYLTYIDRVLQSIAVFTFTVISFIKCSFIKYKTLISAYYLEKGDSFIYTLLSDVL